MELNSSINSSKSIKYYKLKKSDVISLYKTKNIIYDLQPLKFYNIFKKEISIDHDQESIEKGKNKKKLGSVKSPIKNKNDVNNSVKKFNNLISLNKNRNRHKIIFEDKNIIINDITKNYENITNKNQLEKKKISIINKISNDINSINYSKYKYQSINTETNILNINHTTKGAQKLNSNNKNNIRNTTNENRVSLRPRKNKPLLKSSFNEKKVQCIEKKKASKNFDNLNKKKKFSFGDSYEFNFTFNNYNNNFTYNNSNEILKEDKKKTNKIVIENLSKENIINKFKSIEPSSVRNNILGGLKNIISKNIDRKLSNPKFIEKNQKLNGNILKNKSIYAIKIQKVFRGYNFRKNNKLNDKNQRNKSNSHVYIRKKVLTHRSGLNSNINNIENKLINNTYFKERSQYIFKDPKKENESENKIQEIIIDKKKILNILKPSSQRNKIKEIQINNNYSFINNIRNKKYKLLKYFIYWNNITNKKLIVQRLIECFGSKRSYKRENNWNRIIQPQNCKNNKIRYYKRTIFKSNYFI